MQAVILAGGKGTRLLPLTTNLPKPMIPLFDQPALEHTIRLLCRHHFKHIIITLSYRATDIIEYFGGGSRWGVSIQYAIEDSPLGTAGAIKPLQPMLTGTFLVISGDGVADFDLDAVIRFHRERRALGTLILTEVKDPTGFGIVSTERNGLISRFLEKPRPNETFARTVNTGIYVLEPEVLDRVPGFSVYDFGRQLFPHMVEERAPLYGCKVSGYWRDIGTIAQYWQVHRDVLNGGAFIDLQAENVLPGIWVGKGARMHHSVRCSGGVYIGSSSEVRKEADLGPHTVVGANSIIGEGCSVRECIVGPGVTIGRGATLDHCIVGSGCRIPAGHRHTEVVITPDLLPQSVWVDEKATVTPLKPTVEVLQAA
ncbi:MAG: NDP-sugar synthase [Armatimonadetes bacterium]|nr:NDP-sugar synthase [Armatimonadota bacterium]